MKKVCLCLFAMCFLFFAGCSYIDNIKCNYFNYVKIMSGSMKPLFEVGEIVRYETVNFDELIVGDIVLVCYGGDSGKKIVHRIVEINTDENGKYLILKGDANSSNDSQKFYKNDYIGRIILEEE